MKDAAPKSIDIERLDIERYLTPANTNLLDCVDERANVQHITHGVEVPGGIYGILDAIKALTGASEEEARRLVKKAGLPIDAHDDEHHGARGCGYGKLVETEPETVMAVEAVPAEERFAWVQQHDGTILHYIGEHNPTHAIINHRSGLTIDPEHAAQDGFGAFSCDLWAIPAFAQKLGIDPQKMTDHIEQVYRRTVTALGGITDFVEIW